MDRNAPILETARLRLRPHRPGDLDAQAAMWADPAVTRYIGTGAPSSRAQSWMRILAYAGHWSLCGYGYWAVAERETDRFIGEAGLANFERGVSALAHGLPELGFAFAAEAHGKGFASETVAAILAWADARPGFERTACMIDARHAASRRIAERTGYVLAERLIANERETLLYLREQRR